MRNEIEREREKSSAERHSLASQLEQATRESKDFSALLRERDEVMLFILTQTGLQFHSFACGIRSDKGLTLETSAFVSLCNVRWPIHIINPVDKTKLSCKKYLLQ